MTCIDKYLNSQYKMLLDYHKNKVARRDNFSGTMLNMGELHTYHFFLKERNPVWPFIAMRDYKSILWMSKSNIDYRRRHSPDLIPMESHEYFLKNIQNITIGYALVDKILCEDLLDIFKVECQIIHQEGFIPYIRLFGENYYFVVVVESSLRHIKRGYQIKWSKIAEYLFRLYLGFDLDIIWTEFFKILKFYSQDHGGFRCPEFLPIAFNMISTDKLDRIEQFYQILGHHLYIDLIMGKPLKVFPVVSSGVTPTLDKDLYLEIIKKYQLDILESLFIERKFDLVRDFSIFNVQSVITMLKKMIHQNRVVEFVSNHRSLIELTKISTTFSKFWDEFINTRNRDGFLWKYILG